MEGKIKVCEKPIYSNYNPIEIGKVVSIIPVSNGNYECSTNMYDMGLYVTKEREKEFINVTLIKKQVISLEGYGGIVEYTVSMIEGTNIIFRDSPYTYLFKVL
jgi:hypothetical protein